VEKRTSQANQGLWWKWRRAFQAASVLRHSDIPPQYVGLSLENVPQQQPESPEELYPGYGNPIQDRHAMNLSKKPDLAGIDQHTTINLGISDYVSSEKYEHPSGSF